MVIWLTNLSCRPLCPYSQWCLLLPLEPAPKGEDPYHRPRETGQDPIFDNDADGTMDHYEVERPLDRRVKRLTGRGKRSLTEYLVKWEGLGVTIDRTKSHI
jgi:hypothetical protein